MSDEAETNISSENIIEVMETSLPKLLDKSNLLLNSQNNAYKKKMLDENFPKTGILDFFENNFDSNRLMPYESNNKLSKNLVHELY